MKSTKTFPQLITVFLVSAILALYIFSSKIENEASNVPEMSSPRKEFVEQNSKESFPASGSGLQTGK